MAEPVEELYVSIGADVSDLLRDTERGVDKAEDELKKFEKTGTNAFKRIGDSAKRAFSGIATASRKAIGAAEKGIKGLASEFVNFRGIITAAIAAFSVGKIVSFFKESLALTKTQIAAEKQLETVIKSTGGAAGLTAEELKTMASGLQNVTNFGDEAIINGQALLLTFTKIGRDIFPRATEAMLDVSTAMGQDMKTSAIQVGKALNDPITGLAALRRVGIQFTKAQEDQIKSMVEAGRLAEAQAVILGELERQFGGSAAAAREADGGMIALSNTLGDLREIFALPIFEKMQEQFGRLNDAMSDEEISEAMTEIATALGEASAAVMELVSSGALDTLDDIDIQVFVDFAQSLARASESVSDLTDNVQALGGDVGLANLIKITQILADTLTIVSEGFDKLGEKTEGVRIAGGIVVEVLGEIKDVVLGMISPVSRIIDLFGELNEMYQQLRGIEIQETTAEIANELQRVEMSAEEYKEAVYGAFGRGAALDTGLKTEADIAEEGMDEVTDTIEDGANEIEDAMARLKDMAGDLGTEFIDLQEQTNQELSDLQSEHADKMEELQDDHQEKLTEIAADAAKRRTEAERKASEDLLKLEQETERERQQIIEDARLELEQLEEDTDRTIEDERETFNTRELRQTEDHLREMRRMRMRYLDSLEDAVKNRDARAIVDLRRRYEREQQQTEENFQTNQRRERQDQDRRLAEIQEAERVRADAIIEARERDLQSLMEQEQQKRQEIEKTLQQELIKIDEQEQQKIEKETKAFEERVAREQEQFAKRKEELENALKERLEAEAKALADQEDITEEGARAILEALNKVFGVGGDIDELMEAFAERRRQKMIITMEFEERIGEAPAGPTTAPMPTGGRGGPGGGTPRPGGFARGGTVIARQPTVALFGEAGPEMAQFTPLSQMDHNVSATKRVEVDINMSGSAPPGIRSTDRDQIAGVLVQAMRQAGIFATD